ncbi:MAG: DUF711 family protein [Desulfurococcaceae archaeon]
MVTSLGADIMIRAITFFTGRIETLQDAENELKIAEDVLTRVEKALKEYGYGVFTKRISLPGGSRELAYRLVDRVSKDVLVSIGYSKALKPTDVVNLATSGLYVPLLHAKEPNVDDAKTYSQIFHDASLKDPVFATRIAIGFHDEDFQTPYFPDSSSKGLRAIGLALLYPRYLVKLVRSGLSLGKSFERVFSEVEKVASIVKSISQLPVVVDYSLSPWMDNSVAELYSAIECPLLEPGAQYCTWLMNRYIQKCSDQRLRTGFNEVMLPYAEDLTLVEYGASGLIRARDFLAYAATCVAGLDMVVVPENREMFTQLVASTMAVAYVKSRPLALRAIPVTGNPGDIVDLKRFGKVPVIPY